MPRLAVNMMVLNGASVLPRCLLPLKGIIGELVVIDTGSTDNTKQVLEDVAFTAWTRTLLLRTPSSPRFLFFH